MKRLFALAAAAVLSLALFSCNNDPEALLQEVVTTTQSMLPMDVGDGITCTDISLDDNYLTYYFECDEDSTSMDSALVELSNREEFLSELVADPDMAQLLKTIKAANRGYAATYTGNTSGKTATITFEADEL